MLCGTTLVALPRQNHSKRGHGREPAAPTRGEARLLRFGRLLRGDIHAARRCLAPTGSSLKTRWALFVPIVADVFYNNVGLPFFGVVIPAELQIFKFLLLFRREGFKPAGDIRILHGRGTVHLLLQRLVNLLD